MANRKRHGKRIAPFDLSIAAELRAQAKYQEGVLRDRETRYREMRNDMIVLFIMMRLAVGEQKKTIIPIAMMMFGLDRKQIYNVWKGRLRPGYKNMFERYMPNRAEKPV